jgi:hypothetical protein
MKTLYDKKGKPRNFEHPIDAKEAIARGFLFPHPPGKEPVKKKSELMGIETMNAEQLVDYAKNKFNANLDVNEDINLLVAQVAQLENALTEEFQNIHPEGDTFVPPKADEDEVEQSAPDQKKGGREKLE